MTLTETMETVARNLITISEPTNLLTADQIRWLRSAEANPPLDPKLRRYVLATLIQYTDSALTAFLDSLDKPYHPNRGLGPAQKRRTVKRLVRLHDRATDGQARMGASL